MLIDTHCHLYMLDLTPYDGSMDACIEQTHAAGVACMMCIGVDVETSNQVIALSEQYPHVYGTVGVHPSDVQDSSITAAQLVALASHKKIVGIGETGLDYHYNQDNHVLQKDSFAMHINVAKDLQKPLVIHTRDAKKDTVDILRAEDAGCVGGVMHCFTEDWAMAKDCLDLGFYISISGIVTFKNAENVRAVAKQVPLDRLLIETDAPYLAPVPMRGKKNEPKYVQYVAEYLSDLLDVDYDQFLAQTAQNYFDCFRFEAQGVGDEQSS